MLMLIRHLLAILLLPFMVAAVIPRWLLRGYPARWSGGRVLDLLATIDGAIFLAVGLALFAWCLTLFARVGRGTLAPWDPTQRLVAVGPYRHVRNPMICGVLLMVAGQALLFRSPAVAAWAGAFLVINQCYFLLSEEPGLERRFGESYRVYRANVPRWLPRLRPWLGEKIPMGAQPPG